MNKKLQKLAELFILGYKPGLLWQIERQAFTIMWELSRKEIRYVRAENNKLSRSN